MELTAGDLADLSNGSLFSLIAGYQKEYDFFENLVEKPNNPDFLTYYKLRLQEYKDLLEKTKGNLKYRGTMCLKTGMGVAQQVCTQN